MSALNEARRLKGGTASTFCHNNDTYISLLEKTWKRHTKNVFLKTTVWCYPNENIKTSITEKTTTQQDFYFLARIWMSPAKEDLKLSFFPLCGEFFFQQCNITNLPGLQPCFETLGIFFRSHAERNVEIKATSSQIRYIVCQLNQPSTWHMSSF